jgi:uncharacterized protein DUF4410
MSLRASLAAALGISLLIVGCTSTKVTDREPYEGRRLAQPDRIIVYDFAATAADLPEWSEARDRYAAPSRSRTDEEIAMGRRLGAQVAAELVADIREMGLPAVRAAEEPVARQGDIAFVGYFEAIDDGSAAIGFGSGAEALKTRVEGYRLTDSGMRRIGTANVESKGEPNAPGVIAPLGATIATANPLQLIRAVSAPGGRAASDRSPIEDAAKQTADAIAEELRAAFQKQGWI